MRFSICAQAALAMLFSSAVVQGFSMDRRATTCNGHPEVGSFESVSRLRVERYVATSFVLKVMATFLLLVLMTRTQLA
jgi:hypothetical protein